MEREKNPAGEQGGGVGTHRQREEREKKTAPVCGQGLLEPWGLGSRERLGTTPRSQETELGSCVLLPNPGGGQERLRRKDNEEESLWGGWGVFIGQRPQGFPGATWRIQDD